MPELPELEHLRRSLEPLLLGRRIASGEVRRPGYARGVSSARDLLAGDEVVALRRKGKQLAIVGGSGRALCTHLGMSGQLVVRPVSHAPGAHTHVVWGLGADHRPASLLVFDDPRRFGGVWAFPTFEALERDRWSRLGPDGLGIEPSDLRRALAGSRRAIKAALLDQSVVAGIGNIYADEALFRAGLRPRRPAHTIAATRERSRLPGDALDRLCEAVRLVLGEAIEAGGSTLRNYVDGEGRPGAQQLRHRVYGRAGRPCSRCGTPLRSGQVAQRTTTWCPACQL